jgi:hypothetical protein
MEQHANVRITMEYWNDGAMVRATSDPGVYADHS